MINPPRPRATPVPTSTPAPGVSGVAPPVKAGAKAKLDRLPGAFTISPGDPIGGARDTQKQSDDFINGLGQALFGKDTGSVFGGIPVLGDVVRGASAVPGVELVTKAVGSTLGLGIGQAVNVAERLPLGWIPGGSDATFNSLPHTPEWEAVNTAANQDFLAGGNQKFDYTKKFLEEAQFGIRDPDGLMTLSPGLLAGPGGSLGGLVGQLLGEFQLPQRYVERGLAGTAKALSGMNRLQELAYTAADGRGSELSPVEVAAVANVGSGAWTEDRALDFLASHGAGLSSNQLLQIAGSFATDPIVLAGLGTGVLSKLAARGATVAESLATPVTRAERIGTTIYDLQRGPAGHAFKIARTIVDPLSYIGGKTPAGKATINALTDTAGTRSFLMAHTADGGFNAYRTLDDLGMNIDAFSSAVAGRASTYLRMVVGKNAQGRIIKTYVDPSLARPVDETIKGMLPNTPDDVIRFMREKAFEHREFITQGRPWDDVSKTELALNMARRFGGDPDAAVARFLKVSDSELGLYHDALYAGDEGAFELAHVAGQIDYTGSVPYERLNMMNASTLTDLGAAGFLKKIGDLSAESDEARALLDELQTNFPAARLYRKNVQYAIDDLTRKLAAGLDGALPHQVVNDEMKEMPQAIQDFFTDNPHRTLGFSPPEGTRWNIDRDPVTGQLSAGGDPWVGHVHDGVRYRPGHALPFNLAGQVLPVRAVVKAMDWLDAGPRLLAKRVAGGQIREGAQQRFIKEALTSNPDEMTEPLARRLFQEFTDQLDVTKHPTVTSRSLTDLWETAQTVLPFGSKLQPRDVLRWLVNGFEGDIDLVGLGQKIPNRIRTRYAELSGNNAMYEISQYYYSQLKFRSPLAIKFKMQETIEPVFINAAEGSDFSRAIKPGSVEDEVEATLNNWNDTSLLGGVQQTDLLEQSNFALRGATVKAELNKEMSLLQRGLNPAISEYKRSAQMSMIKARLGTAVRKAFEADGRLDDFLEFKAEYARAMGQTVDDAEYAMHWMNHVQSSSLSLDAGGKKLNLATVFHEAETWSPANAGALKPLALDMAAARLDGLKGWKISNMNDLVAAMTPSNRVAADKLIREIDIREAFGSARVAAPPAYVDRFMTAMNFDWGRFWRTLGDKYSLTSQQSTRLQTWVAEMAHMQGFKPTEFLSQVVSSGVKQTWTVEEIEKNLALGLNVLQSARGATPELLVEQLSAIFVGHLHPSGRETLVRAMNATDATIDSAFAKRLMERVTSGIESADPNLENAYRNFGDWARATLTDSALGHGDNPLVELLKKVAPGGKPFDHTEGALVDAVFARMREIENDTYRAQFFARDRMVFERSLNHPMFALYPASYMWFKIMPLMVKFIAKSPFGIKTGAVAYALADIQRDVAIQNQFDPEFAEMLDGVDSNQLMWFLSYMIPATPWDIPAQWPAWARDLAGQGLANERRAEEGKPIKGLNVRSIAERVFNPLDPFATPNLAFNTLGALGDILSGTQDEQKENPGEAGVTSQIAGPVQELAQPLGDAMTELERILGQQ